MLKPIRSLLFATAIATALVGGTASSFADVYVNVAPPPLREEVVPVAPHGRWVWRPGFWRWNGVRYHWVHGRYVHPRHVGAAWLPGHWDSTPHGWIWVEGHWR